MSEELVPLVLYFGIGVIGLIGATALALIGLTGFRAWIDLKRAELDRSAGPPQQGITARIDVADLKERVRRLEAIAAGVDL